jgi:hypothetical protein
MRLKFDNPPEIAWLIFFGLLAGAGLISLATFTMLVWAGLV